MDPTEAESTTPTNLHVNHKTRTALELVEYNRRPHINSLPPEVLHSVFLPVGGFDQRYYYTRLLCFRMVCRYWIEVIDSTPELWNSTSSQLHPDLQGMIIQNSRNQLLDVEYDGRAWDIDPERMMKRVAAFASLMKASVSRWQTLKYGPAHSESDAQILSLPMHNLKRIEIDGPTWRDQCPTLDAPKLSYVYVRHCSLNWSSLSGLQVLILNTTDLSLNRLMVILKASPGLCSLQLEKTSLNVGPNGFPNSFAENIFLRQLRALRIAGASAESVPFLLDWIEMPSLEVLRVLVEERTDPEDYTQLYESVGRHIGAFPLPKSQKQARVLLEVGNRETTFGVGERRISIWSVPWAGANNGGFKLAYIASAMKQLDNRACEEVTMLELACSRKEETGAYLHMVHSRFPWIDQVLLRDEGSHNPGIRAVVQHLSTPLQSESSEEWLLPKLTKLELDLDHSTDTDIVDDIVELVNKRRGSELTENITELRITMVAGAIDPSMIETLGQSVMLFDLIEVPEIRVDYSFCMHDS